MTDQPILNVADLAANDRKLFGELRQLATHLLMEKIRPEERATLIRAAAHERGFSIGPQEILAITAHARRELQGRAGAVQPGEEFDIPDEVWLWDQVIVALAPTLIVALQKVGKTALIAGLISAWHHGAAEYLGFPLVGPCPPFIIAGTDQTFADWRSVLAPVGLMDKNTQTGKWRLTPGGPIKALWHRANPVFLDEQGIEDIAKQCEQHPGAVILCDTYAALTAPLGLDEAKPEAAEPLYNLMEVVEPHKATPLIIHHASKSRANERASNASRNSNAIPAAVSQIISLQWLEPDKKNDHRINLTTEGRNSKPVDLVIEQVDRSQWISHGSSDDIKEAQRLAKVESNLGDRQELALEITRAAWDSTQRETTALGLFQREPKEFTSDRQARRTLDQLVSKGLLEDRKAPNQDGSAQEKLYRPSGADHNLSRGAAGTDQFDTALARGGVPTECPDCPDCPEDPLAIPRFEQRPLCPQPSGGDTPDTPDTLFTAPREASAVDWDSLPF